MSTYFTSRYKINNTDICNYFPAHEVIISSEYTLTNGQGYSYVYNLSRNSTSTTNYMVFPQIFASDANNANNLSANVSQLMILQKKAISFSCYFYYTGTTGYKIYLQFLVIYTQSSTLSYLTSQNNYKATGSNIDPTKFPQYQANAINLSGTAKNQRLSTSISLSSKNTTSTNYMYLPSYYYNEPNDGYSMLYNMTVSCLKNPQIYYNPKSSTSYTVYYMTGAYDLSYVNLDSLIIYNSLNANNNISNTNYKVKLGSTSYDLVDIFPNSEMVVSNAIGSGDIFLTLSLVKNSTATINYAVFCSYFYNSSGSSGGTYGPTDALPAVDRITVTNYTATTFDIYCNKSSTGNNWNGGLQCLVVYY